jgi:hypothetical protein
MDTVKNTSVAKTKGFFFICSITTNFMGYGVIIKENIKIILFNVTTSTLVRTNSL